MKIVKNELYIIIGRSAAKSFFPEEKYDKLIFSDNILNEKKCLVLPHPSPLNIRWFKEHPEFEEYRINEIRKSIKKSYWNETNLRTYQKLLKLQKETGHSLQSLSLAYFFHQPFQTVPVTEVSNLNQLKDALAACDIDFEPELFGGWVIDGGDR